MRFLQLFIRRCQSNLILLISRRIASQSTAPTSSLSVRRALATRSRSAMQDRVRERFALPTMHAGSEDVA